MVLDRAQRAAFEHATSSRVASIVGPPGCGKSFAGSELARAILAATQETLLVVCYTNHALDQFLCHLLDRNEQRIVRIGGKSKEVRLEPYSLYNLKQTRKEERDAPEKRRVWALHQEMEAVRMRLHEQCDVLRSVDDMDWRKLKEFLMVEDPGAARQLSVPTEEQHGYQTVARGGQRMRDDYLWKAWQAGVHPPPPFQDRQALPMWRLSSAERQAKRAEWVKQLSAEIEAELIADRRKFDQLDAELSAFDTISEQTVLREARVIAATTTGAAKYHSLIKSAKPGVLLLEEAGEVLEAHVISSLSPSIRQVIMIGDHQQLRPKVETYHLTAAAKTGYDLNVSLFERLIKGGMAHAVLETQHRMRPEISSIARHMTYPELRDHESVMGREDVLGLAKNVCFINHSHLENGEADDGLAFKSLSKVNEFEADMAVQVAQYLLLQGYRTDSIVVLTPYLGQLKILNERFKKHRITATVGERDIEDLLSISVEQPWLQQIDNSAKGIRTCTIDNYQGEEADLIITTLVRSNRQGQLGFLGKADAEQRVNVLCTRARLGMIFIGNADCFLNASPRSRLWTRLLGFLRERGEIVDGLPIKCQAHQEVCQPVETSTPVGLRQWCAQGAGCGRKCDGLLRCGHVCPLKCHSWPHDETMKCEQIVREMCPAGLHRIERACSSRALPRCDHEVIEHCTQGHPLVRRCGDTKGRPEGENCAICRALGSAKDAHDKNKAKDAQELTALLQRHAEQATSRGLEDAEGARDRWFLAAQAELAKLTRDQAKRRMDHERNVAARLDEVTHNAQEEVRQVGIKLEERRQHDEAALRARRDEHQRQLQAMEERMEEQRAAQQRLAAADIEKRDEAMRNLQEALTARLAEDEAAIAQVYADRPDPADVNRQLEQVRRAAKQVACLICMDDLTILDGPLCAPLDGHFLCTTCFDGHVAEEVTKPSFAGDVRCPSPGCKSNPYGGHVVARHAKPATFEALNKKVLALRESENNAIMQRQFEERLDMERRKFELRSAEVAQMAQVEQARKHIIDNILTLKCPRCGQAFVDFNGCMALTCSRGGCNCGFCALCLKDCGTDAHAHVASCASSGGNVFGSFEDFEKHQVRRKELAVKEYLGRFPEELRIKIRNACDKDLRDARIEI